VSGGWIGEMVGEWLGGGWIVGGEMEIQPSLADTCGLVAHFLLALRRRPRSPPCGLGVA
jgi:hypothetical protein